MREKSGGGMPAVWADSGSPQNPDPRPDGVDSGPPPGRWPGCPGSPPLPGWSPASLLRWGSGLGRAAVLPDPSVGARVRACVCVPACAPSPPARPLPGCVPRGSRRPRLARAPFHVASLWSFLTLSGAQLWWPRDAFASGLVDASRSRPPSVPTKFGLVLWGTCSRRSGTALYSP